MNGYLLPVCGAILFVSGVLGLYRFVVGPSTLDRILAFDFLTVCVVGEVIVTSFGGQNSLYLELIATFCLLGFTTTLAFMDALFRERGGKSP